MIISSITKIFRVFLFTTLTILFINDSVVSMKNGCEQNLELTKNVYQNTFSTNVTKKLKFLKNWVAKLNPLASCLRKKKSDGNDDQKLNKDVIQRKYIPVKTFIKKEIFELVLLFLMNAISMFYLDETGCKNCLIFNITISHILFFKKIYTILNVGSHTEFKRGYRFEDIIMFVLTIYFFYIWAFLDKKSITQENFVYSECFNGNNNLQTLQCIGDASNKEASVFLNELQNVDTSKIQEIIKSLLFPSIMNLINIFKESIKEGDLSISPTISIYVLEQIKRHINKHIDNITFSKEIKKSITYIQKLIFQAQRVMKDTHEITKEFKQKIITMIEKACSTKKSTNNLIQVPLLKVNNVDTYLHIEGDQYITKIDPKNITDSSKIINKFDIEVIRNTNQGDYFFIEYCHKNFCWDYIDTPRACSSFFFTEDFRLAAMIQERNEFSNQFITLHEFFHTENKKFFSMMIGLIIDSINDDYIAFQIKNHLMEYHSDIQGETTEETILQALNVFSSYGKNNQDHPQTDIRFFVAFFRGLESLGYNEPF
jgi:hypothetical protein